MLCQLYYVLWLSLSLSVSGFRTIIDVIGSDPAYSEMVYLLQESRMIPLINRLNACTLLVLGNKELDEVDKYYPTHLDKEKLVRYLLLKDNLTTSDIYTLTGQSPLIETWLGLNGSLGTVDPFGPGRGQMLQTQVQPGIGSVLFLGGVRVIKGDIMADNGIIHVLEDYIHPPSDSIEILQERAGLSYFSKLLQLTPSLMKELKTPEPHSLFVWEDQSAFANFTQVERNYLSHAYHPMAAEDRKSLVASAFVLSTLEQPYVIYKQSLLPGHSMYSFNMAGKPVVISRSRKDSEVLTYNSITAKVTDILTSDGAIHVLNDIPKHDIKFNVIKYVIGLNASTFATSLNSSILSRDLLSGNANCTVLVPGDFVLEPSADIIEILQYHILPGQYTSESLSKLTLVPSFLGGELLKNHQQRIRVSIGASGEVVFNGRSSVVGNPEKIGGVSLLKITHTLFSPREIIDVISYSPELSKFYKLLKASDLEGLVADVHGVTALLPTNDAFQLHSQALLYDFLMQPLNKQVLQDFIRLCILVPLKYSTDFNTKITISFPTLLEKQNITIKSKTLQVEGSKWDLVPQVVSFDKFISTGVLHKTDALLAPPSQAANLRASGYLKGHADIFLRLVGKANLTSLFETSGTVMAPIDTAWKNINLSKLEMNPKLFRRTIRLHFLSERLPTRLDLLSQAIALKTLSKDLPDLRVVFTEAPHDKTPNLKIRILDGPMSLTYWNATVQRSGQAHDASVALVDSIIFIETLPSNGPSFLTVFFSTLLSLGGLGYAGYLAYFRFFPVQARGYEPIPDS